MFPIFAGNSASTGYNFARSVRLRSSATAYFSRTPATTTNQQVWTWSAWVKRGGLTAYGTLFNGYISGANQAAILFWIDDTLSFNVTIASVNYALNTTQVFRDPSAWYHIVYAVDTTQATAANRIKLYVNGTQVTAFSGSYPPQNSNLFVNATNVHNMGRNAGGGNNFDGYLAEVNLVDGLQLAPTSFGSTNSLTGVWQPASYTGSYGTNGFEENFTDNSALTTSSNVGLGKDFSGNGNYWTTNNISITAGVTYDSMTDVPTLTSATAANYCTWNPLLNSSYTTLSNGNLTSVGNTSTDSGLNVGTIGVSSGKWYWEGTIQGLNGTSVYPRLGFLCNIPANGNASMLAITATLGVRYTPDGNISKNANVSVGTFATFTTNDVIAFALDVDNLTCGVYKNNTLQTTVTGLTMNNQFFPANVPYDGGNMSANFGQRPFTYTPPTGYVALNTFNLPTSTIVKGNTVMDATLYTGTLLSNAITNAAAFKPDLVWVKSRSAATDNELTDSVRGVTKSITSNSTAAEATDVQGLTAFNSNGFTVGTNTNYNNLTATYVGWQWQAGQGSTSSNTNGSITSTVSVNASAGFSVVTYTGTGSAATVGHGLGVAPSWIVVKRRDASSQWNVYHSSIGATGRLYLDATDATNTSSAPWNNTAPTSSVFTVGTASDTNASASTIVAYCWTPIAGFSAFGSYTGNGSADGPFVYTGFRPRWVMFKRTDSTSSWTIWDTAMNTYNVVGNGLYADLSNAESTGNSAFDYLSNGFKVRNSFANINSSGGTYIYMAFAENPFKNSLAR